jgi:hypothetical protein
MSAELHLQFFKQLELCTSVYLGTIGKKTYEVHYEMHGKVKLYSLPVGRFPFYHTADGNGKTHELRKLIKDWIGWKWWFSWTRGKYLPSRFKWSS